MGIIPLQSHMQVFMYMATLSLRSSFALDLMREGYEVDPEAVRTEERLAARAA